MRHTLMFMTFILFAVAYSCDYVVTSRIDTATLALERYRETFTVNVGLSPEGNLSIKRIEDAPVVSRRLHLYNQTRNLGLYVAEGAPDDLLFVESAKPSAHYHVSLPFSVSREKTGFRWVGPTAFIVSAIDASGLDIHYAVDVHTLTLKQLEPTSDLRLIIPGVRQEIDSYL